MSKHSKSKRTVVSRALKEATTPRAKEQLDEKKATAIHADAAKAIAAEAAAGRLQTPPAKTPTLAEALNAGSKVKFPKGSNAVRVTVGNKSKVVVKKQADTLKGVGVETAEFGTVTVKKGVVQPDTFAAVGAAKPKEKPAETPAPTAYPKGTLREQLLVLGGVAFKTNDELVERVHLKGFKKDQIVRCLTNVVSNPKHPFNNGVSELKKHTDGTMTLVALKPAPAAK